MVATTQDKQIAEAEQILGKRLQKTSLARGFFFGRFLRDQLPPYPDIFADHATRQRVRELEQFCRQHIDAAEIDRQGEIPSDVIQGLGRLGVLGACLPRSCGGLGLGQTAYCQLLEVLGAHCASTALFVNAHHSIGPRALVLFGTPQQQQRWLPKVATGEWISAFALTEPEAGSDAANVQTTATPTADGRHWRLNGQKRWITNGGIAQLLTVIARVPDPDDERGKITAFLVTPDMPGFEVVEERMDKCGVRGTVTSRLAFHDMPVPAENVLGRLGQGLQIALTVLDYGRTTFGATCSGAAWFCVRQAVAHANRRVQFGRTLGSFELVKQKLARMRAGAFAIQSCTYQTAALIDAGRSDFMVETAMLKVFATETLWQIINDTIQIFGGKAYFKDEPYERMMRDARINMIGEGANDVLRVFTALVGMRDVGSELEGIVAAAKRPLENLGLISRLAGRKLGDMFGTPVVPVHAAELAGLAGQLGRAIHRLGLAATRLLRIWQRQIVDRQHQLARIANAATELYVSVCVLNRLDQLLTSGNSTPESQRHLDLATGQYYLAMALRRVRRQLQALWDNDDGATNRLADLMLAGDPQRPGDGPSTS